MPTEQQLSGRALDAAIAEKVMDHVIHVDDNEGWCEHCGEEMMQYRVMQHGYARLCQRPLVNRAVQMIIADVIQREIAALRIHLHPAVFA